VLARIFSWSFQAVAIGAGLWITFVVLLLLWNMPRLGANPLRKGLIVLVAVSFEAAVVCWILKFRAYYGERVSEARTLTDGTQTRKFARLANYSFCVGISSGSELNEEPPPFETSGRLFDIFRQSPKRFKVIFRGSDLWQWRESMTVLGIVRLVLLMAATAGASAVLGQTNELPPLSALSSECIVELAPLGPSVPISRSDGIWLSCRGVRVLLAHQDNLVGKVKVDSQSKALEFVRFFSARPTFARLHSGGCVEVSSAPSETQLFYGIDAAVFKRRFREPQAEQQGSAGRGGLGFIVSRTVVCLDQRIYELREQVDADGMYFELSRRVLLKKARDVGIHHVPPH
jgi:hypothetical protein